MVSIYWNIDPLMQHCSPESVTYHTLTSCLNTIMTSSQILELITLPFMSSFCLDENETLQIYQYIYD